MGLLVEGRWQDRWYETAGTGGRFVRSDAVFRSWVTADGSPGPSGDSGFKAEAERYHLYVSLACPWAHRALIVRELKGLQRHVSVTVVDPLMLEEGWTMGAAYPGATLDVVNGKKRLHEIYTLAAPRCSGRVTVPVLWDKVRRTIVSNESSEILRMLNRAFDELPGVDTSFDLYPEVLRSDIDAVNARVYDWVNDGVYKAGFATAQHAYDDAVTALFDELDRLEDTLSRRRYLVGSQRTEADWRLFTTLVRFDAVYHGHFKCNLRRITDYPNLAGYARDLYQVQGVAQTVDFDHIKRHYYGSHKTINPSGIVPRGPLLDFAAPHDRARL
jgi:putative glutathione S-transferase